MRREWTLHPVDGSQDCLPVGCAQVVAPKMMAHQATTVVVSRAALVRYMSERAVIEETEKRMIVSLQAIED